MTEKKRTGRTGPRPNVWICGPDPEVHKMYLPWLRMKAQCAFRKEEFTITFEQYYELWKDDWDNRGRHPDNVCLTRIDIDGAWELGNVEVISRKEHFVRQGLGRADNPRNNRAKKNKSSNYIPRVK